MGYGYVDNGDVFLMGQGGKGGLNYASGLYRAIGDLDLQALQAEFVSDPRPSRQVEDISVLIGSQERYEYHRAEANFQEWLIDQGYVERIGCKLVALMARDVRRDDTGRMGLVVHSSVLDPQAEDAPSPHP